MLDADVTDSVIGEGCVIKVLYYNVLGSFCGHLHSSMSGKSDQRDLWELCSFLSPRCFLGQNCKIHHSVVGLRSCISEGAIIEDTLLMGADYYEVNVKTSSFTTYRL